MITRDLTPYTLPTGETVMVDETAAKGAKSIDYTLRDGTVVAATRADRATLVACYQSSVKVAQVADEVLSVLLHAKYGKRAGDMRYRPAETVEIAQAMRDYLEASEARQTAWLAYVRTP